MFAASNMQPMIQLHDKKFIPFLPEDKIQEQIARLGQALSRDLQGDLPLFLPILNGSFMFAADLMKQISIPAEISFVKIVSYVGTASSGHVKTLIGLDVPIRDRTVVILEDIIDTGRTLTEFLPVLQGYKPKKILLCSLLFKPEALQAPVQPDYTGFEIPNHFIVGYGLDYNGLGRNLRDIYRLAD